VRAVAVTLAATLALPATAHAITAADGAGPVPSQALVRVRFSAQANGRCGGTVRDALHVVTAAHCTFDVTSRALAPPALPAAALTVIAGVANAEDHGASAQRRRVVAISSDPLFASADYAAVHDDAVLTLDRPLRLGGSVTALAPAVPGARAAGGRFSGFGLIGRRRPGGGTLRYADLDVLRARAWARARARVDAAVMLCGGRAGGDGAVPGGCSGDSGGGLVDRGRLVGVASFVGPPGCGDRRFPTVFVRVAEPGIDAFVSDPDPVPRPAVRERPSVTGRAVPGGVVRCDPGRWSGHPRLESTIERASVLGDAADAVKLSTRGAYRLTGADLGETVFCVVRATNKGGSVSRTTPLGLSSAGPVAVRDGAAPASRFTRVVCTPERCVARLVASDDAPLAGARVAVRLSGRPLAARSLGHGAYEVRTPVLRAGRHRLVAEVTDAQGNAQARPATVTLSGGAR
jgi:hypothetical protein